MKLHALTALASSCVIGSSITLANDEPRDGDIVAIGSYANHLFVPVGFDDNDETVVVVDGFLPSGCYQLTKPKMEIDPQNQRIKVTPQARYFDRVCIEALIPYNVEVNTGILPKGKYWIEVDKSDLEESLDVSEATAAGPDDYLYAPVEDASISKNDDGRYVATLDIHLTNTCFDWNKEDFQVINSGKTIEVLPIMKEMTDCQDINDQVVKETVVLPENMQRGRHLLHVRSLNGKSINRVFSVTRW